MGLDIKYDQLIPVTDSVRAGIVAYDGKNQGHQTALRQALPKYLGQLAAVHGTSFPEERIQSILHAANAKQIEIEFLLVGLEVGGDVKVAGISTSAPTFGIEWDADNNLHIKRVKHGEDRVVDKDIGGAFKALTGIGAGTWFLRQQIRNALSNEDWGYAEFDNEHAPDNFAQIAIMEKFGAVRGTPQDSPILKLDGLTHDMTRRLGVTNVLTESLPLDPLGLRPCPDNFMTRWASPDGKQQIAVVYRYIPPTSDEEPVVWAKIHRHGSLPDGEMTKEVLSSLLIAGVKEITSPERLWLPPGTNNRDMLKVFGGLVPTMHLHIPKDKEIVDALQSMGVIQRTFGHSQMVSGVINPRNLSNPAAVLGHALPDAKFVTGLTSEPAANEPYFDLVSEPAYKRAPFLQIFSGSGQSLKMG